MDQVLSKHQGQSMIWDPVLHIMVTLCMDSEMIQKEDGYHVQSPCLLPQSVKQKAELEAV